MIFRYAAEAPLESLTSDFVGCTSSTPHPVYAESFGEVRDELYQLREELEKFSSVPGELMEVRRGLSEVSDK
eukprot:1411533-Amphidinium_carterae.1